MTAETNNKLITKILFFIYFAAVAAATAYLTCTLWLARPKEQAPASVTLNLVQKDCTGGDQVAPRIIRLEPNAIAIGENYVNIAIYGCNLKSPDTTARFNGQVRTASPVSENELIAPLQASDFIAPGNTVISVEGKNSDNKPVVSSASLRINSTSDIMATWVVFRWQKQIDLEVRLILMMLVVGAFAACISGMKSFADYAGDKKLDPSWNWFYCAQPLMGAGMAFIFYVVIRGGFLAGTNADVKAVNPFGFVAVAALVGMFSDAAFRKLNEVFDNLFQAKDTRSGKLCSLSIKSDSRLPPATQGQLYDFDLAATGGTAPYTWSLVKPGPGGLTLSAQGKLSGVPVVAAADNTLSIQVADSAGAKVTMDFKLTIT